MIYTASDMSIILGFTAAAPESDPSIDLSFSRTRVFPMPMALVQYLQTHFSQRATTEIPPMTAVAPVQTTSVP